MATDWTKEELDELEASVARVAEPGHAKRARDFARCYGTSGLRSLVARTKAEAASRMGTKGAAVATSVASVLDQAIARKCETQTNAPNGKAADLEADLQNFLSGK